MTTQEGNYHQQDCRDPTDDLQPTNEVPLKEDTLGGTVKSEQGSISLPKASR
jgi:hypothetical protein